ncbi:ABC transporter permease [Cellulomonas triticagri]|uniref:FtsX-like permease family protein n=1 Tax=Cellulomonas triticagri TaxID=2483352 RepID=A0A3M2J5A5_9CELL|nr:FtsX-like permease family protein [Cellulomonas triticagri]RMI07090.1 FtsX-like permease family protein [Cellulomonas triticagri]
MWRLTLAQMRRSIGRLTAAGVAVAIGTAFVAATLLSGAVMQRISYDSVTAQFGDADLVAVTDGAISDAQLEAVRAEPGVAAADPVVTVPYVSLSSSTKQITQTVIPVASDPSFETQHVTSGALPTADGEIALPERAAERLEVGLGDTVTVAYSAWAEDPAEPGDDTAGTWVQRTEDVTVAALTTDPTSAWAQYDGVAQATTADTLAWYGTGTPDPTISDLAVSQLLVAVAPGADTATVTDAVQGVLDADGATVSVSTRDAAAERMISGDGTAPVLVVVLSFAAVALLVAGLVIANTFQVLVAQRTRTLALLRCVGAVRSQVRRSVLLEATLLGVVASVAGLVLGGVLVQAALLVMQGADLPFPVPSAIRPTVASVVAPLAVGVLVTVGAALTPARIATRVAPIAALRPSDTPAVGSRAGRVRLALSLLLVIGGVLGLAGGVALAQTADLLAAVGLAILGGAASFIGLLVSAVFWMPKVVAGVGRLAGRAGMPARLAAANTGRNPARTAATSTALLIGVTLVAMMSTGAVTARATLGGELDARFPVDLQVSTSTTVASDGSSVSEPLPAGLVTDLAAVDGVVAAEPLATELVALRGSTTTAVALTPAQATTLLRNPDVAEAVADGTVVVPDSMARAYGIEDGDSLAVARGDEMTGEPLDGASSTDLTATVVPLDDWTVLVTPGTLDALGSEGVRSTAWLRLADADDAGSVLTTVQDLTADSTVDLRGAALERALYERAIDTMLAVVVGLLAVAVVIALIGVTNTLSLSVIERRRESATLRAVGLTRRQLRASMAVEGTLIAGVGAVVGVLLGVAYGWLGSAAVLSGLADLELRVPWADLGIVLGVALVAGVLASVLPGRSAARTPPVAALAVD